MKTLGILLLVAGLVVVAGACSRRKPAPTEPEARPALTPPAPGKPTAKNGRGTFTIGKATTYVTGPLDENGHIDYAAALNDRLSKGVTPENNACVLLWKAFGPHPEGATMPPAFFEKLGMTAPPAAGDYFIPLRRSNVNPDTLNQHTCQPWTANQEPNLAAWLTSNQKPLVLVAAATRRTRYFSPLIPPRNENGSTGLINTLLPGVQACREFAAALAARAMLSLGHGYPDAAWQDLLACHRLGRFVGRGGTLIEGLVGMAIEQIACRSEVVFLAHAVPDAKHLEGYIRDLRALPPLPDVIEKADFCERCTFLDNIMLVDLLGLAYLQNMGGGGQAATPDENLIGEAMLTGIDWDPALETANRWFDRMVAVMRVKDRAERVRKWEQLQADLLALKNVATDHTRLARMLKEGQDPAKAKGQAIGDILISLMMPAANKAADAGDRTVQTFDNTVTAFALEWYRRDTGRYPDRLDVLAPKYLKEVPQDVFSGGGLIYRPEANGYLLYGVGINGRDDGGRGPEDQPPGDDQVVRMPLPR